MTKEEVELFKVFCYEEDFLKVKEDKFFIFKMDTNDELLVSYFGDGESELNPFTQEDDYYYAFNFEIINVILDKTNKYKKGGYIEISKYVYPSKIIEL